MHRGRYLAMVAGVALLTLWTTVGVQAAAVGKFSEVEGPVEVLRGGKTPGAAVKIADEVSIGDVVRTKTGGRAQIKFIDDTTMTIAPGSRVAIEEYMVDAKGNRQAVLQVFQGLLKTAVGKVQQTEKPDFILKSHTAVMGVRGTTWYAQLTPTATEVYTANSLLEVSNVFPEVPGKVLMKSLQYVMVGRGKAPTVPVDITQEDLQVLEKRMSAKDGATETPGPADTPMASLLPGGAGGSEPAAGVLLDPAMLQASQSSFVQNINSGLYVPPQLGANLIVFQFLQTWSGSYQLTSQSPFTTGIFSSQGFGGLGSRTGVYPGHFTANFTFTAVMNTPGIFFSPSISGLFHVTNCTGSVRGVPGGALTGSMTMTATTSGGTTFSLSGPVTLLANGTLTFTPTGSFTGSSGGNGPVTGTWTQNPVTFPEPPIQPGIVGEFKGKKNLR